MRRAGPLVAEGGLPRVLRYGTELTSRHFLAWCIEGRIELVHMQPGRPMQNGRVESFHGKLRDECFRVSRFANLFEARRKIAAWQKEYNEEHPHSSLGYRTAAEFARAMGGAKDCGKDGCFALFENAARFPLSDNVGGDGLSIRDVVRNPDVVVGRVRI